MKKTLSMNVFCSLCYASIKALRRALVAIIESFSSAGSQTLFFSMRSSNIQSISSILYLKITI